jgi:ERCC4-related helicase
MTSETASVRKEEISIEKEYKDLFKDVCGDVSTHLKTLNELNLTEEQRRTLAKNLANLMSLRNEMNSTIHKIENGRKR